MSAPHSPSIISLLKAQTHASPPVSDWLSKASSEDETLTLLTSIQGIPLVWLEWANDQITKKENQQYPIGSQLDYALATISNGVTYLQESKFLCDVLENALRSAVINFILLHGITYRQLYPPNFLKKIRNLESKIPVDSGKQVISPSFILDTGFEQLRRTIALNWKTISPRTNYLKEIDGFGRLFWEPVACRDLNLFNSDMDKIRDYRNSIAHTRRLLTKEDLLKLNKLVCKWLQPLDVELLKKVVAYRKARPFFLQELDS